MYAQKKKTNRNKAAAVADSVAQKKANQKQTLAFDDNRRMASVQRKLREICNSGQHSDPAQLTAHVKECDCACCTNASVRHVNSQAIQAKSMSGSPVVYQLKQCPLCSQLPDYDGHTDRNCPFADDEEPEVVEDVKETVPKKIPGWKKKGQKKVKMGMGERDLRKREGHGMMTKDQAKRYVPDYKK